MENKKLLRYITRASVIAALYVSLTLLSWVFGLSSGVIQFRISEALCVLAFIMPEAVPGLAIGCFLSNLVTGSAFWDIIFGSLATLIGAYLGRALYRKLSFPAIVATLPTVFANTVIVPFVLIYAYGVEGSYFFFALTVFIGEFVCATLLGSFLFSRIKKSNLKIFGVKK